MDINSALHFISGQIEKIIGVIAALFIATTALLIFRSIKEEKSSGHSGSDGHATDAGAIEDALRRVLSQTSITTRSEGGPNSHSSADESAHATSSPSTSSGGGDSEKDERISALQGALQKAQALLKERMETVATATASGVDDPGAVNASVELRKEVEELRARLSEYEIIEDDIADLAMFKEENARLKQEVEVLKAGGGAQAPDVLSSVTPTPAELATTLAANEDSEADPFAALMSEAKKQVAASTPEPIAEPMPELVPEPVPESLPVPEPKQEPVPAVALVPAAAAAATPGTGLNDAADTEKMALEAQALADAALKNLADDEEGVEVLSNLVDTDKLIDEVNALDAEDLMSEFKDKGKP